MKFYSFLLHWEKIWCIFPKGRNCDLGIVLERVIKACINWNMMHMRLWKGLLHIPSLYSEIHVTLGSFVKPILAITQGELEPQFASKDSYFEQNIKQVWRSNWEVKKTYMRMIFNLYYHSYTFRENLEAFGSIWRSRHQN